MTEGAAQPASLPTLSGRFACHSTGAAPNPNSTLPFTPGPCPGIPSVFGGVAFGMTRAQARKISDGDEIEWNLNGTGWTRYRAIESSGWHRRFSYSWSKADKLDLLGFEITESELGELERAWGKPISHDGFLRELVWFDPAAHVRVQAAHATISKGNDDVPGYRVDIQPYVPLAELLGPNGILAQPLFGKTREQIATAFPGALEVVTKAQKAADLKAVDPSLEHLASDDWVDLHFPSTELDSGNRLRLEFDEQRLVKGFSFSINFGKDKTVGDELVATMIAAFGPPTSVAHRRGDAIYVFTRKDGIQIKASVDPGMGMCLLDVTRGSSEQ